MLLMLLVLLMLRMLLMLLLMLQLLLKLLYNICRVSGFEPEILRQQTGVLPHIHTYVWMNHTDMTGSGSPQPIIEA